MENSICDDYMTEKIDRAFSHWLVPIVLGGSKYSEILPPNSYIDIHDFESPAGLASHLDRVAHNETLYNEYFKWRTHWRKDDSAKANTWCQLCRYLRYPHLIQRSNPKLSEWFSLSDCTSLPKYYDGHAPLTLFKNETKLTDRRKKSFRELKLFFPK